VLKDVFARFAFLKYVYERNATKDASVRNATNGVALKNAPIDVAYGTCRQDFSICNMHLEIGLSSLQLQMCLYV
jgi:hypothetical protein